MIDRYDWAGGSEAMLRFGPDTGPVVIALLPLLEEANRTRAFIVTLLRRLAEHGIGSVLPDFPGTGESIKPTNELSLVTLCDAVKSLAGSMYGHGRTPYTAAIRSGALLDTGAPVARWHFAPQTGPELWHELRRQKLLTRVWSGEGEWYDSVAEGPDHVVEIAGNRLPVHFFEELYARAAYCTSPRDRLVRLETDPASADLKVASSPLWRRAEPGNDSGLAALLADDIAAWVRACEG